MNLRENKTAAFVAALFFSAALAACGSSSDDDGGSGGGNTGGGSGGGVASTPLEWMDSTWATGATRPEHIEVTESGGLTVPSGALIVAVPEEKTVEYPEIYLFISCQQQVYAGEVNLDSGNLLGSYGGNVVYGVTAAEANAHKHNSVFNDITDFSGCEIHVLSRNPARMISNIWEFTVPEKPCLRISSATQEEGWATAGECGVTVGGPSEPASYQVYLMTYDETDPAADQIIYNDGAGPHILIAEQLGLPESAYADVVAMIQGPGVDASSVGTYWYGDDEANAREFVNSAVLRIGDTLQVDDGGEKSQVLHIRYAAPDGTAYSADYEVRKTYTSGVTQ